MQICRSLRTPVEVTEELLDFVRHREAIQHGDAVTIQPELRRERHRHTVRRRPVNGWAQVLRSQVQPESVCITQATIHFDAGLKFFPTEGALARAGGKLERTADPQCITELPGIARKVLFRDKVFTNVPAVGIAPQNQLELNLALFVPARQPVRDEEVIAPIVANDLSYRLVGAGVFEFGVEHGINPVLARQWTETVLPAKPSEDRALVLRGLTIKVKLRRPPSLQAILEFDVRPDEAVSALRIAHRVEHLDVEVPGFLHFLGVSDKIGIFLS